MKPSFPPSRDAASPGAAASAPTATTAPAVGLPLLALGFRPFYLLAGAYAALAVPLWIAVHGGALPMIGALAGSVWHAHEMIFGFWHAHEMIFGYAFAVIAGFLFTAVRNWTNQPTPSGGSLALVCALWLAARVCVWSPWVELAAAFDLLFALAVAIGIGRPMIASANRRNYFFIGLVVLLGLAGAALLIGAGGDSAPGPAVSTLGLDLVGLIIAIIAGRVVPMFTNNAVLGAGATRVEALERSALGVLITRRADCPARRRRLGCVASFLRRAGARRRCRRSAWRGRARAAPGALASSAYTRAAHPVDTARLLRLAGDSSCPARSGGV